MFISVKKKYRLVTVIALAVFFCSAYILAKNEYSKADFGAGFDKKAAIAKAKLVKMNDLFETCTVICKSESRFMQAIIFPELMRYNSLKDGIEAESLRTLYVQFGKEYANFSIGIFQMKPGFAEEVEQKARALLSEVIYRELQLGYTTKDQETIRMQRVERLQDEEWQMVYLTAFICICNETCKNRHFAGDMEKVQWYATLYNAGFDKSEMYIGRKIKEENFYLQEQMPGKKFKYAAIAGWFFETN